MYNTKNNHVMKIAYMGLCFLGWFLAIAANISFNAYFSYLFITTSEWAIEWRMLMAMVLIPHAVFIIYVCSLARHIPNFWKSL